jgi:hypothetical protein
MTLVPNLNSDRAPNVTGQRMDGIADLVPSLLEGRTNVQ